MTYLFNIGSKGNNADNKSGIGSRGYQIFRRGRRVVCRWAGIQVTSTRQFVWTRAPAEKRFVHRSVDAARDFLDGRLHAMTCAGKAYEILPVGCRIHRRVGSVRIVAKTARRITPPVEQQPHSKIIRRAISIRQPFVELILRGAKLWEFRNQPTNIRERVYLYASLRPFDDARVWKGAGKRPGTLAVGKIVGSVEIVDCRPTADGGFKYKLSSPKRLRRALIPRNQPQPRFWLPQF